MTTRFHQLHTTAIGVKALATSLVATLALAIVANATAQSPLANEDARNTATSMQRPTFWLVDQQGWRIPLPNWSIEDVMRAVDAQRETQATPLYSVQRVSAEGEVVNGVAQLTIRAVANVADGVVRIPLGLQEGVYIPPENATNDPTSGFSYTGPGLCAFEVDAQTGGYYVVVHTPRKLETGSNESETAPKSHELEKEPEPESAVEQEQDQEQVQAQEQAPTQEQDGETNDANSKDAATDFNLERIESEASKLVSPTPRALTNQYEFTLQLSFVVEKTTENKTAAFVDLDSDDTEYRFVASFPPSLNSDLKLHAPPYDLELTSVKGAAADAPTTYDENFSEIKLRGLGRGGQTVEIAWRKKRKRLGDESSQTTREEAVVLQVENALIKAELSEKDVSYDASLPIKVFGGKRGLFQITLPTGATVTPDNVTATDSNGAKFDIQETSVKEIEQEDGKKQVLEVRLREDTKAATINLKTHAPNAPLLDDDAQPKKREISGFAVLNAQKQFGRVRIVQSPDANFNVAPTFGVSSSSDEILEDGEEVFFFYAQPFQLLAEKYESQKTVNVRPEYLLNVGYNEQTLRVRFLYSIYGSKVKELKARIDGWEFSELVDPKNLFKQYDAAPEGNGVWRFPLAAPTKGEIALEMILRRAEADNGASVNVGGGGVNGDGAARRLAMELPTPVANSVESGALVVAPEDSVEFKPDGAATQGLTSKTARSMTLAIEQVKVPRQTTLYYQTKPFVGRADADPTRDHELTFDANLTLVADLQRLPQEIEATVKTDASISEKGVVRVSETVNYKIEREPLDSLAFVALEPLAELVENRAVKCFVDGKPQNLVVERAMRDELSEVEADKNDDVETLFRAPLDAPKLGTCVVTFQYELPSVDLFEKATNYFTLKLFQPLEIVNDVEVKTKNELTLSAPSGYELKYQDDRGGAAFWRADPYERAEDARAEVVKLRSHVQELYARFGVALGLEAVSTIIDRAWIQSWITSSMRVDRAAYRVSCPRSLLEVRPPDAAVLDRIAVAINGKLMPIANETKLGVVVDKKNRILRIPVSDELKKDAFLLEISYNAPSRFGAKGRFEAQFPKFLGKAVWIRRTYWQIVMRYDRHIIVDPEGWTAEFVVKRRGWSGGYQRFPTMSQEELAQWVGIAKTEPLPEEANVYLYSAFGDGLGAAFDLPQDDAKSLTDADEKRADRSVNETSKDDELTDEARVVTFYVVDRALLILIGSGAALIIGLSLTYFPVLRGKVALFLIALIVTAVSAFRPLVALLFLQTTVLGVALAFVALALSKLMTKGATPRATPIATAPLNEQKKRAAEQAVVKE